MVPCDQHKAALVRPYRAFGYVWMLICLDCPGYDHQMGEERPSDRLILCVTACTHIMIARGSHTRVPG